MRNDYALTLETSSHPDELHAGPHMPYKAGMAAAQKKRPLFQPFQTKILVDVIKKHRKDFRNQSDLAKALKLTQPALSNLLAGKWKPGMTTALAVAELEGVELADLIGPFQGGGSEHPGAPSSGRLPILPEDRFHNVDVCVKFFGARKSWSPWTIAAAKAGVFGDQDFPSPEWETKLDRLEKALEALRR